MGRHPLAESVVGVTRAARPSDSCWRFNESPNNAGTSGIENLESINVKLPIISAVSGAAMYDDLVEYEDEEEEEEGEEGEV